MMNRRETWLPRILLGAAMTIAVLVYIPSLHGIFVLDDSANLANLESIDENSQGPEFALFVISGNAGPTSRPVALLSFLAQHESWPHRPFDFKIVNLLIHLANCLLVFLVLQRICVVFGNMDTCQARWVALAISVIWLLHPVHVSTVAYVIQRMNLLAGFFMLAGTLAYLEARRRALSGRRAAMLLAWVALPLLAILGALSKENAAALLFLVTLMDYGFPAADRPGWWEWWRATVIILPLAFVGLLVITFWDSVILPGYDSRDFDLAGRLLSQPRALLTYIHVLLVPAGRNIGLFHDDFVASTGLLDPWTTLPAILALAALVISAWRLRSRFPLLAFGIGWFLLGHIVESTFIALELYFEHRNYIPVLGLYLAAATLLLHAWKQLNSVATRRIVGIALLAYATYLPALTLSESLIWGDPIRQSHVWAKENPQSERAQVWKLSILEALGEKAATGKLLEQIADRGQTPAFALLTQIEMACVEGSQPPPDIDEVVTVLANEPLSKGPTNVTENILILIRQKECPSINGQYIEKMIRALMQNPNFDSRRELLLTQLSRAYMLQERQELAIAALRTAIDIEPSIDRAMQASLWLALTGKPELSRHYLEIAREQMKIPWLHEYAYSNRIAFIEHVLATRESQE